MVAERLSTGLGPPPSGLARGLGTHYSWAAKIAGVSIERFNVFTEFIPNRRITDRSSSSLEGTWTYSFEPDGSGTKLTVENQVCSFRRLPPWSVCWTG